jgi:subtilisin family serine protease
MIISTMLIKALSITVMVIDTGYTPMSDIKQKIVFDESKKETTHHGSKVIRTMLKHKELCTNITVHVCGYETNFSDATIIKCLELADKMGVDFVNISINGKDIESRRETSAIKTLTNKGVHIVMASGNESKQLDTQMVYPQVYGKVVDNLHVVSAYDVEIANRANWTINNVSGVIYWEGVRFRGTSFSAPRYMNMLLDRECNQRGYK